MPDGSFGKVPGLPPDFQQAAAPADSVASPPKVTVSLPIDADILAYFQAESEPTDWAGRINGLLRFYMETNQASDADFHAAMEVALPEMEPSG